MVITGRACYVFMITSMPLLSIPSKNIRKPEVLWGFLMYLVGRDVCVVVYRNFFGILKLWWKFQNQCVRTFLESWSLTSMSVWPGSVHWGITPPHTQTHTHTHTHTHTQKHHPCCAKPRPSWMSKLSKPTPFLDNPASILFFRESPHLKKSEFSVNPKNVKGFSFLKPYFVFQN